jgi:prolyl oligopeptidase
MNSPSIVLSVLGAACWLTASPESILQLPYPPTPAGDTVHTYHGVQLADPFVWLEDHKAPDAEAWFRAQDAFARSTIARMPLRDELYQRIRQIDEAKTVQIYSFNRVGERYFYLKQEVGQDVGVLYFRDGLEGDHQLIADPAQFAETDGVYSIESYQPAPCGTRVALAIAPSGSEIPTVYVVDVATGQRIGQPIPRVRSGAMWFEDSSGFYYTQLRPEVPGEPRVERYSRQPVKRHTLGNDPASDPVIVSYDTTPQLGLAPVDSPYVMPIHRTPWTLLYVSHGVDRAATLFFAPTDRMLYSEVPWMQVSQRSDWVESLAVHQNTVFLLSSLNAPRKQILRLDLRTWAANPQPQVVAPESDRVLSSMLVAGDRLFVTAMDGGIDRLFVADLQAPEFALREITLPLIGRVTFLANDSQQSDVFLSLTSWQRAPAYYRWDPATDAISQIGLRPLGPYDSPANLTVERLMVTSHDGAQVPLTLLYRSDLVRDGSNPALLAGYGAYGIPQRPAFGPTRLAWLERGGIYAVAHVRGGGEFGKEWHQAGHLERKRNSWLDFNAAAQFLIDNGYSARGKIGAMGGSMGGVLVGRAMTSAPDLYGAVVSAVGNHNPVRNHRRANGPGNYPEYGNPLDPEQFLYVLAMDSYHAVRDGVRYPPMLLTAGFNDSRVDPWMPGKMAARLQQANPEAGPYLLRIEFRAGHGGVARSDIWEEAADTYAFLFWALTQKVGSES